LKTIQIDLEIMSEIPEKEAFSVISSGIWNEFKKVMCYLHYQNRLNLKEISEKISQTTPLLKEEVNKREKLPILEYFIKKA